MPNAAEGELQYEAAQTQYAMAALTDSGDHQYYTGVPSLWSLRSGYKPIVRPNGVITGCVVTPAASGSNDVVDISAGTAYIAGVKTTISADTDVSITRGLTTDTHNITSITINSGGTIAAVAGTDNAGSFSETRAADGGPPLIAVDSIELAQVRTTSVTAAAVTAAEIFSLVGTHRETYDYPSWSEEAENGRVCLDAALPLIHTGPASKKVYASYASPSFIAINLSTDFTPPEKTYSVSSNEIYRGKTIASSSGSLGQGSFTAYLRDGVTDGIVGLKGDALWFKFFPDRLQDPYVLANGILGISRTFPTGDNIQAACTITPEFESVEVAS